MRKAQVESAYGSGSSNYLLARYGLSARSSRPWRSRSAAARLVWLSLAVAVAVLPSIASAAGKRGAAEVIVVQPANPAYFAGPTPECPEGVGQLALTGPTGSPLGPTDLHSGEAVAYIGGAAARGVAATDLPRSLLASP